MTPIADMVERMLDAGIAHDLVVLAVRTAEASTFRQVDSRVEDQVDAAADRRREWDRNYRKTKRLVEKQTMLANLSVSGGHPPDTADKRCDLTSLSSSVLPVEKKKEVVTRARGTRLFPGWQLSPSDHQFARDAGMSEADIDKALAEFIDYWIGVPGQRGTKLDWSATWRNRVRQISTRGKHGNGKSVLEANERITEKLGGVAAADAYVIGSSGPTPFSLDFDELPPSPKLISSR